MCKAFCFYISTLLLLSVRFTFLLCFLFLCWQVYIQFSLLDGTTLSYLYGRVNQIQTIL